MRIMPENISTYGGDIDSLGLFITIMILFWFAATLGAMIYFSIRFRRKKNTNASYLKGEKWKETKWVEIPHFLVIICDIIIIAYTIIVWNKIELTTPEPEVQVRITGRMWNWMFTYPGPDGKFDTADDVVINEQDSSLHVPVNKNVVFQLRAVDVLHSFFVKEIRLKQDAIPGRTITRWFNATKTGKYELACAEICGPLHAYMRNYLVVETQEDYDRFLNDLYSQKIPGFAERKEKWLDKKFEG